MTLDASAPDALHALSDGEDGDDQAIGPDPFAELEHGFTFLVHARRRARVRAAGRRGALTGAMLAAALVASVVLGSVPQVPGPPA